MYFLGDTHRRGGKNWSDYWNQVLGKNLSSTIPSKEQTNTIRSRTLKDHASKRLLLLGLMADSTKAAGVPNISLSEHSIMEMKLSKSRGKYGNMKI